MAKPSRPKGLPKKGGLVIVIGGLPRPPKGGTKPKVPKLPKKG